MRTQGYMLKYLASFLLANVVGAHLVFTEPASRVLCFHDGAKSDVVYRGSPCGRSSRGIVGVVVDGADVCVRALMNVPHAGPFRLALAPGTAPAGPAVVGSDTSLPGSFQQLFDIFTLQSWPCSSLPTGCAPSQTGAFAFPLRLPANVSAMLAAAGAPLHSSGVGVVATLQVRQFAPEFNLYYHECADVLVVNSSALVPAVLQDAWAALAGPCPGGLTFTPASYPLTFYVLQPIVLGLIGLVLALVLAANAAWLARRANRRAALPIATKAAATATVDPDPAHAPQAAGSTSTDAPSEAVSDVQGSVAAVARPPLCRRMATEARVS